MLIAVNAGNSRVLLGGYEEDGQVFSASIATEPKLTRDDYACKLQQVLLLYGVNVRRIHGGIVSSVVPSMVGVLMGWCVGLLFRVLRRVDHKKSWSYFVGAMSAPLLNTIFFMGYIVLVFYKTDYIQERVASLGAANPLMFVVLLVGVQGLIEIIVGCAVGGVLARAVASFLGHRAPAKAE